MRRGSMGRDCQFRSRNCLKTLEEPAVDEIGGVAVVKEIL